MPVLAKIVRCKINRRTRLVAFKGVFQNLILGNRILVFKQFIGVNHIRSLQQFLHKGHQRVGCQAKAQAFRNMRSSFWNKPVESCCKNEATRLELSQKIERLFIKNFTSICDKNMTKVTFLFNQRHPPDFFRILLLHLLIQKKWV